MPNDFLIARIPVGPNLTPACPEEQDAVNGYWWTDAVLDGGSSPAYNQIKVQGTTTGDEYASFGIIGAPAWDDIGITIDFTFEEDPTEASVDLYENAGGTIVDNWVWSVDEDPTMFGSRSKTWDISGLDACGGFLQILLNAANSSDIIEVTIDSLT